MKQALSLFLICFCFLVADAQESANLSLRETAHVEGISKTSFLQYPTLSSHFASKNRGGVKFMFGLKAGASTANIAADEVTFESAGRQFKLAVDQDEFSYHIGVFGQVRLNKWTIQPEVLFRSARSDYMLSEFVSGTFITSIRKENYSYVDVPLMIAYRIGALRLQGGPVAKFYIDSKTELTDIDNFSESYQQVDFGYQAGIGLDIWRLVIDLKYDRDLDDVGDHMIFNSEPLKFNSKAGRFLFSIGYSFLSP